MKWINPKSIMPEPYSFIVCLCDGEVWSGMFTDGMWHQSALITMDGEDFNPPYRTQSTGCLRKMPDAYMYLDDMIQSFKKDSNA